MSYQIKVGSKIIKDTFYTLGPVNWILRIFVLSTVRREQNQLVQCWSWSGTFIVLVTMLTTNLIFLAIKVRNFGNTYGQLNFIDSLQLTYILGFAEYIVDLVFVYRMRHRCVKYLQFYANIDKVLKVPDFSQIRMKNLAFVLLIITGFTLTSIFDYIAWSCAYGWVAPTLYSLDYIYGFINALTIVDVISNVIQIEYRVKEILGYIKDYYATSLALSDEMNDIDVGAVERKKVDRLKTVSYGKAYDVLLLSKSYVMLMEQVNFINAAYGVRVRGNQNTCSPPPREESSEIVNH